MMAVSVYHRDSVEKFACNLWSLKTKNVECSGIIFSLHVFITLCFSPEQYHRFLLCWFCDYTLFLCRKISDVFVRQCHSVKEQGDRISAPYFPALVHVNETVFISMYMLQEHELCTSGCHLKSVFTTHLNAFLIEIILSWHVCLMGFLLLCLFVFI